MGLKHRTRVRKKGEIKMEKRITEIENKLDRIILQLNSVETLLNDEINGNDLQAEWNAQVLADEAKEEIYDHIRIELLRQ